MRIKRGGAVLAALVLVVILAATLTPSPGTPTTASLWCIACGEFGALDVAANIVMFLPFGFALALATERRRTSVIICVVTTLAIESLQVNVVIGRDASLSDLLANSLGGWLGVELALARAVLLRPSELIASRLAGTWAFVFAAVCGLTSAGLQPAAVPRSLWVQWTPPRASYEPFTGRVLAFDLDGIDLPLGYPATSLGVDRVLSQPTWTATATVATDALVPRRSVIVRIAEEFTVLVSIEQYGRDLACLQKTRSSDFRFRSPKVAERNAFLLDDTESRPPAKLTCARRHGALVAGINGHQETLRLSPSLGWAMLSPFDLTVSTAEGWVGLVWLFVLAFPAGYWAGLSRGPARGSRRRAGLVAGAIIVALTTGLALGPRLTETATATAFEWVAATAGVLLGGATAVAITTFWSRGNTRPVARSGSSSR